MPKTGYIKLNSKKEGSYQDNNSYVVNNDSVVAVAGTGNQSTGQYVLASHVRNDNGNIDSAEPFEPGPITNTLAYSWSPCNENESCSSYVMRQLGAHNYNKIANQTRGCYTVLYYEPRVEPE